MPPSPGSIVLNCEGDHFFRCFTFWTAGDPAHGDVVYVSQADAEAASIIKTDGDGVYMGTSVTAQKGNGQTPHAVRVETKQFDSGVLAIMDVKHVPTGMGLWPAWWMYHDDSVWPVGGEFDMWETVNDENRSKTSIHTTTGCKMPNVPGIDGGGNGANGAFTGGDGAGVWGEDNAGAALNAVGGGYFAVHWTSSGFDMYQFPRDADNIPSDITSMTPDVSTWGAPWRHFPFGADCPSTIFYKMKFTFNIDFCGGWAGSVYPGGAGKCNEDMKTVHIPEAYWNVNWMRVFDVD
jgi:hypothetical protein